ncbi:MAG: 4-alpha-glucanotransferase [Oscillospiraceae bacterium]|nr:4-alpha-glucanotransferase [Oscillospiraceae bacterium]
METGVEKSIYKYPRSAGVLMSVPMLSGPYGIGVLGAEAMAFVDFLSEAGFHVWQVLPVEHTDVSFSPYQCVSAFAGEPMLIDPRMLLEMDLITADELAERAEGMRDDYVNYELVHEKQWALLRKAYSRLEYKPHADYKPFWLETYALYMTLHHRFGETPWYEWPDEALRSYDTAAIKAAKVDLYYEMDVYRFIQWIFDKQWQKLKEYAASRKVSIVGDMPFYVSGDSAEVWSARDLFDAEANGDFAAVSGAPPDYFTPLGQLWGNPIYNWRLMKRRGYRWWARRIKTAMERYDYVRIDHFRGFDTYWEIPAGAPDATTGKWVEGPGLQFFKTIEALLGSTNLPLIAEDLGHDYGNVPQLLKDSGYRGMRSIQFGFIGDEKHIPHFITEDEIAYTGTHDNTTIMAWMMEMSAEYRDRALLYIGFEGDWTAGGPNSAVIRAWMRSLFTCGASLAIMPIQDLLGYGADTRTNTPGTIIDNWVFRVRPYVLDEVDKGYIKALIIASSRDNMMDGK